MGPEPALLVPVGGLPTTKSSELARAPGVAGGCVGFREQAMSAGATRAAACSLCWASDGIGHYLSRGQRERERGKCAVCHEAAVHQTKVCKLGRRIVGEGAFAG